MKRPAIVRPSLEQVLAAWRECLVARDLPETTLWIFSENLCLEHSRTLPGGFRFGFQTRFTPPPAEALEIAYGAFAGTDARMVFHRLGSCPRGSVGVLLCDAWFEARGVPDGYIRHDDWGISFCPGQPGEIEEVTDLTRWVRRVRRDRTFHDFDFAMSLETIDEICVHGRALMPYERFAEKMLNRLRRVLGQG